MQSCTSGHGSPPACGQTKLSRSFDTSDPVPWTAGRVELGTARPPARVWGISGSPPRRLQNPNVSGRGALSGGRGCCVDSPTHTLGRRRPQCGRFSSWMERRRVLPGAAKLPGRVEPGTVFWCSVRFTAFPISFLKGAAIQTAPRYWVGIAGDCAAGILGMALPPQGLGHRPGREASLSAAAKETGLEPL